MKVSTLLENLISKAEIQDSNLLNKIQGLEHEVPDEIESALGNLISINAAKSKADLAQHHISKHNHNINQSHSAKLQGLGLSESEIEEVLNSPIEERLNKVASLTENRLNTKYSASKDEQVKELERQIQELRDKADRLQKASLNKDSEYSKKLEEQKTSILLQRTIEGFPIRKDTIPYERALPLIIDSVNSSLAEKGAKIIFINEKAKVVRADDETLDYYDEKSNPVDARVYIEKVITNLNLLDRQRIAAQQNQGAQKQVLDIRGNGNTANDVFRNQIKKILG